MASDPAHISAFKAFARRQPDALHLPVLQEELYGPSERASAIMLGSILETNLTVMIEGHLRSDFNSDDRRALFDFNGPLGNFAAKIAIAFAFGLIGRVTRKDLDLIRLIRNEFAHSRIAFDFSEPTLKGVCDRLKSPDWAGAHVPHGFLQTVPHEKLREAADKTQSRTRYVTACIAISERLLDNTPGLANATRTLELP